jgi:medium-chain acyl-[acyl-carrier-protein] hydrolase
MEPFVKQFEINDLYVDCFGRLKPSAILFLAQEVAGHHCLRLGLDWETLAAKNLFWAIVRTKAQVTRLPHRGETVTVRTWPMPTTRTAYPRAMEILDEAGNVLVRTISLWVLMDLSKRTMVLPGKSDVEVEGIALGTELSSPRNITPAELESHTTRTVAFSDLDRNAHMNNTRYMDWVCDLLDGQFHRHHGLKEFNLCYINECREGQVLQLSHSFREDGLHVEISRDKERVFAARLGFCQPQD